MWYEKLNKLNMPKNLTNLSLRTVAIGSKATLSVFQLKSIRLSTKL